MQIFKNTKLYINLISFIELIVKPMACSYKAGIATRS